MSKECFKVRGPGSQDDLVAIDLLVLDNKCDITELLLVKDVDEVFLYVVIVSSTHYVVCVSVVLRTSSFLGNGSKTTDILQTFIWLVLLLRSIQRIIT